MTIDSIDDTLYVTLGGSGISKEAIGFDNSEWLEIDTGCIEGGLIENIAGLVRYYFGIGYKKVPDPKKEIKEGFWSSLDALLRNKLTRGIVKYQLNKDNHVFIKRHDLPGSAYGPVETQYLANFIAIQMIAEKLGKKHVVIVGTSAAGTLQPPLKEGEKLPEGAPEPIPVGSLVIATDYMDQTGRNPSAFDRGVIEHGNPKPASPVELTQIMYEVALEFEEEIKGIDKSHPPRIYNNKRYVSIPGNLFGTFIAGNIRSKDFDVVGMTAAQEALLALMFDFKYGCVVVPVDYDINANHFDGTVNVMGEMSRTGILGRYISRVQEELKKRYDASIPDKRLVHQIIYDNLNLVWHPVLKRVAKNLQIKYPMPTH